MMGHKERSFQPLLEVTLEDLVSQDHFYRHLHSKLHLSFVRDLVRDYYSQIGRPSIDPVVFFKLQLCIFFEGIRSERQLMEMSDSSVCNPATRERLDLSLFLTSALPQSPPSSGYVRLHPIQEKDNLQSNGCCRHDVVDSDL